LDWLPAFFDAGAAPRNKQKSLNTEKKVGTVGTSPSNRLKAAWIKAVRVPTMAYKKWGQSGDKVGTGDNNIYK